MAELVDKGILKLDFVEKGQQSKRYKIGEKWELNWDEICEVIDGAQTIDAVPIDWIKEWCLSQDLEYVRFAITKMMYNWKAEREEE